MVSHDTPVNILMILDGWGITAPGPGNAVHLARTPFLDHLAAHAPGTRLTCFGPAVGLPPGTMGNSEVGHTNIGAGRCVMQDLMRINTAIADGSFYKNPALTSAMEAVRNHNSVLHLMGLVSDGGVHSHIDHLLALLDMAKACGVPSVSVHAILDGRDTPPDSGIRYMEAVMSHIRASGYGAVKTIVGRYWTMDRDTRWDRVQKGYDLLTAGIGQRHDDPVSAIRAAYDDGQTDEFVTPRVIGDPADSGMIRNRDGLVFFNFRSDRAREITRAFIQKDFTEFDRSQVPDLSCFVTMTPYSDTFELPTAFGPQPLTGIFGEVLSRHNIPQLRIAETEKYAHVTYFFNGGNEAIFPGEERVLIPSPRDVATYDLKPEMSAQAVADRACQEILSGRFGFVILNFANMDMVGHTGILSAAIRACETVDRCAEKVVRAIWQAGGTAFVTADHGNSEQMMAPDGSPHTAHTLNQVPFYIAQKDFPQMTLASAGILGDIAPTILDLLGMEKPSEMTGTTLITGR